MSPEGQGCKLKGFNPAKLCRPLRPRWTPWPVFASPGGCPPADGPEGEPRHRKIGHSRRRKVGPGNQQGKRATHTAPNALRGLEGGLGRPGGGMGGRFPQDPTRGGPEGMLLCNFRARPMAPPLWARSAEIRPTKKGAGFYEDRRPRMCSAASAGCQPVRPRPPSPCLASRGSRSQQLRPAASLALLGRLADWSKAPGSAPIYP